MSAVHISIPETFLRSKFTINVDQGIPLKTHILFLFLSIITYWPCILLVSISIMNGTMKITFGKMKELRHAAFSHRHFCSNFYAINLVVCEQRHFAFM